MRTLDLKKGCCFVYTFKEGLLSLVAHDLKIRVERFSLDMGADQSSIMAFFDPKSLRAICAMKNGVESPGTLSAKDLREIDDNITCKILIDKKNPQIQFISTQVYDGGDRYEVSGILILNGKEHPITCKAQHQDDTVQIEYDLHLPDFGIKPFSAMFGTIKIKPDIKIVVNVPVNPG
jgi:hypothetical protein